jgi:hypothetical protein
MRHKINKIGLCEDDCVEMLEVWQEIADRGLPMKQSFFDQDTKSYACEDFDHGRDVEDCFLIDASARLRPTVAIVERIHNLVLVNDADRNSRSARKFADIQNRRLQGEETLTEGCLVQADCIHWFPSVCFSFPNVVISARV